MNYIVEEFRCPEKASFENCFLPSSFQILLLVNFSSSVHLKRVFPNIRSDMPRYC